jgi:hypothetical protein
MDANRFHGRFFPAGISQVKYDGAGVLVPAPSGILATLLRR